MKRLIVLAALVALAGAFGVNCQTSSGGGGGGLFSMGDTETSFPVWDMVFMVTGATCPKSFAGSGAELSLPGQEVPMTGGIFPGVKVVNSGYEYDADVPEVSILAYYLTAPVNPGDTIVVHFTYQAEADGEHGDYFLVRIIDGDRFRVPVQDRGLAMAQGVPKIVNYSSVAQGSSFAVQFIVGLSDPTDALYLDDVKVRVAGVEVIADNFEAGTYEGLAALGPAMFRLDLRPTHPAPGSSFGPQAGVVLEGTQSLGITGGRYFQLYGQGATMNGISALVLTYADPSLPPFFGQSQAAFLGGIYLGDYLAYDNAVATTCSEQGQLLIAPNNSGNADISGVWYLTLDASCDDGDSVHVAIGNPLPPHAAGDPVSVANAFGTFVGYGFSINGDPITNIFGLTLGNAGVISMSYGPASAQLVGGYDKSSGVFAGQILGAIPKGGGLGVCAVTSGTFLALIDSTVYVPPPL
ncbi:MAG TPA: hypothetical protein VM658_02755 [bacterium]|nr:hypothetical protein [bacterium]